MKTKTVQWSYPTSDNAKQFGFFRTGCWTLETIEGNNPPEALQGFHPEARDSALSAARWLDHLPWNWMFVKFHPEDAR